MIISVYKDERRVSASDGHKMARGYVVGALHGQYATQSCIRGLHLKMIVNIMHVR